MVWLLMVRELLHPTQYPRRFRRVEVAGDSMLPDFRPGDRLLVGPPLRVRAGQVVAVVDPRDPDRLMVKRVYGAWRGQVDVRGDNQTASTDSRQFGRVPRSRVVGRVIYRYGPEGRVGWFPGRRPWRLRLPFSKCQRAG
jgi:nickel-type superoxide dismutase maturation protease